MVKLIFGVDDTSPPFMEELNLLQDFCNKFPKLKVTHFVPACYSLKSFSLFMRGLKKILPLNAKKIIFRALDPQSEENRIDLNKEFCTLFKKEISKKRFSAELHGLTHFSPENLSAEEFLYRDKEEIRKKIEESIEIFRRAKFPEPKVLAPPGWGVTTNLLAVLKEKNLAIAGSMTSHALSARRKSKGAGLKNVSPLFPERVNGVLNIPRNWDLKEGTIERAEKIITLGGLIGIHAHIAPIGVQNDVNKENLSNLAKLLEWLESNCSEVQFMHFREVIQ